VGEKPSHLGENISMLTTQNVIENQALPFMIKMMLESNSINRAFWERHMRTRGYDVTVSGNAANEVIIQIY